MIRLTTENTVKAVVRCKQLKPRVKFIKNRLFAVQSANNSNVYQVSFDVKNGEKFGQCECIAAEKGLVCYHIVAGATANIYRQSLKLNNSPYVILVFVAKGDRQYSVGKANGMSASLRQSRAGVPTLKASNNRRRICCSPSASGRLF